MSGWIKLDKKLVESIRFRRVVRKLRETSNALRDVTHELAVTITVGGLMRFWAYADSHIDDDNALAMTIDEVDELVGIDGFGKALPVEWLKVLDADHVQLPDFLAHNGSSEKQRRDNARRQAAYRHRRESRNVTRDVTDDNARNDARPDQTREDQKEEIHTARARAELPARLQADEAEHHVMFERVRKAYPPFAGRQNWIQAEHFCRLRIDEGSSWNDLLDAVKRYAEYVKAGGVSSTQYVLTPEKFFSAPDRPWTQGWPLPEAKPRGPPPKPKFVPPPEDPDLRTARA